MFPRKIFPPPRKITVLIFITRIIRITRIEVVVVVVVVVARTGGGGRTHVK